jgi:hypothetical protein
VVDYGLIVEGCRLGPEAVMISRQIGGNMIRTTTTIRRSMK